MQKEILLVGNIQIEVNNPTLRTILRSISSTMKNENYAEEYNKRINWDDFHYADIHWWDWQDNISR